MVRIKKKVLEKLANDEMIFKLIAGTGKSYSTIYRWVRENHENLTNAAALKVIREELNLTDDQILEETKKALS